MKNILIIGSGGHAHSCIEIIESTKNYKIYGLISILKSKNVLGYPIVGCEKELKNFLKKVNIACIAIGQIKNPNIRFRLFNKLNKIGFNLPSIQSPLAICSRYAKVDSGTIIMHGSVINAAAEIGKNCIINTQAIIEHDVKIDSHCHISTGAKLNGGVRVGQKSFIGSGVTIKEGVIIGSKVIIGLGQVITRDIPDGAVIGGIKCKNQ